MKTSIKALLFAAALFITSIFLNSCAKADHSTSLPNNQQIIGKWSINRIQLKIYINGVFIKDTILKQTPKPENFVQFQSNGGFEYRFNTPTSDIGTFELAALSKVVTNSLPQTYNWTILTLTDVLFTVVSKEPDPAYPGALVERYQTFVR